MYAQNGALAEIGQSIVGAERDKYFVADAMDVENQIGWRLEGQSARQ